MGGIRFCVCRCGYLSENPLSALARNPNKGLARQISRETRCWMREGMSERGQKRPVGRREQKEIGSSQQKSEKRLLGPVDQ